MKRNRILAAFLSLTLLCGALPAPALGSENAVQTTPFVDIQDPKVAEAAELLRLLGVVNGTGGALFTPNATLTRAEFCKMAVEVMGNGDLVPAQMNRTIFKDVPSTHWARGYINVATQGSGSGDTAVAGIIRGDATGCFRPNDYITYAEAVTILMRVLGYSDSTVGFGATWYDGYMSTAASIGLTDDLTLAPLSTMTRGQTAILLYHLYFTFPKDSKTSYLVTKGGKEVEGGVILDVDAKTDDGSPALKTDKDVYKTDRVFSPTLEGQEGKLLLDADDKAVAFMAKEGATSRVVNVTSAQATYLMASGGERISVEPTTKVYREGKATTWNDCYLNITSAPVTFHYGADGKLSYLFFSSASSDSVTSMVARTVPNGATNPFASMAGGTYTMFKNGVQATAADIRQYDVATYDPGARVIQVSDLKLTGVYENVSPNPSAPITITVMNKTFDVLASARDDIASFKVGDQITLLLTVDNKVAGAVSAGTVRGDAVGIATVTEADGSATATVKLLQSGLEVSGKVNAGAKDRYNNQLVTVTSSAVDRLTLSLVTGSSARGSLDVTARKLGDRDVAENVRIYDRVKNGQLKAVAYEDLSAATIPQSKISFAAYDYAGRVKYLILNDATGDAYSYGYLTYTSKIIDETKDPTTGEVLSASVTPATLCVRWGGTDGKETYSAKGEFNDTCRGNAPGGVAYTADGKVASFVYLESLTNVGRSAFDPEAMTVTVAGVSYPVSSAVQCYNRTTKTWYTPGKAGMEAARAFSDALTLYYDRAPEQGGKIRLIVIP